MTKQRHHNRHERQDNEHAHPKEKFVNERAKKTIKLIPKTNNQSLFISALETKTLVIGSGDAGVGKSYLACTYAANRLLEGRIGKIIIVRPYSPLAGRTAGLIPGDYLQKLMPFVQQQINYITDVIGKGALEVMMRRGDIEVQALEAIRGRDFDNSIIICDEFQCCLPDEIEAVVTRISADSQLIALGDPHQNDVKKGENGLDYLERIVRKYNIQDASIIKFTEEDCVRSGMCKDFLIAFKREKESLKKGGTAH